MGKRSKGKKTKNIKAYSPAKLVGTALRDCMLMIGLCGGIIGYLILSRKQSRRFPALQSGYRMVSGLPGSL
ncbi:MAG: hypothetical protein Q4F29_08090, partial [Lachnospiraceae bacterium]|nr:hypothetical protein [Lachnospiraceae bacterium]